MQRREFLLTGLTAALLPRSSIQAFAEPVLAEEQYPSRPIRWTPILKAGAVKSE